MLVEQFVQLLVEELGWNLSNGLEKKMVVQETSLINKDRNNDYSIRFGIIEKPKQMIEILVWKYNLEAQMIILPEKIVIIGSGINLLEEEVLRLEIEMIEKGHML